MARYAISAEGAAQMRSLAKQLYTEANAILESSTALEAKISAVGDGLGIYESEILGIVQQGRNTLKATRDDILNLAQRVLQKADEIDELVSLSWGGTAAATAGLMTGTAGSLSNSTGSLAPTRTSPRDLVASQFGFTKDSDGNMVYDSPTEMDKYLYATQGDAYSNIQGTCGLCSCANIMRLAGVDIGEKKMIDYAMANGLCSFDKDDSAASGGTGPLQRQQILSAFGIQSHLERVDTAGGIASDNTMNSIADNVASGKGVIVSVDAGHFYRDHRYLGEGHAVTVTSVKRSSNGDVIGYYVCDSNEGTVFIDKSHLQQSLRASYINVTDSIIR